MFLLISNVVFISEGDCMRTAAKYTSVDPCYNYTVLDNPWRATNIYASGSNCDQYTCVALGHCDTATTLWIRGGHPTVEDGVVTRDVCGHWHNYCCYFGSFPIKVKACPGNYYVYELVRPTVCNSAYCAATLTGAIYIYIY
uniref:UMOD/GP2/OIT3-like D8C domain-containing protein n=1 Tax=Sinocyclocheilus anshuiensis TaxID=1608454 RepID=A0A671PJI0_9TELE